MSESQYLPRIQTQALWTWDTSEGTAPVVKAFPTYPGSQTKTGLTPDDLRNYIQTPILQYGNPPIPVSDVVVQGWIRFAEDEVEQDTNIRLCQTWIAAPPTKTKQSTDATGLIVSGQYQNLGIDYDFYEPAYDFFFERARDDGWIYNRLRWRPVQSVEKTNLEDVVDALNFTGLKSMAGIYPLLNTYFRVPATWIVEDQLRGLIRLVPATNTQMLPLFALQLAFLGFSQSVPGGWWLQYTAGLTANDYQTSWSFIKQLVLARAGITAFQAMSTGVNLGALETMVAVDGLQYRSRYSDKGVFNSQISNLQTTVTKLTSTARNKLGGPYMGML